MPEKTVRKSPFVDRVPALRNKKWGGMENKESEALGSEILKAGKPAVQEIMAGLQEVDNGSDWKERLLLHMLVTDLSVPERKKERGMLAATFVEEAASDRPASVRAFLIQELRLIAEESVVPKLVPLLRDKSPLVVDAAAAVMVSIGEGARKPLQEALKGAENHSKRAIKHALNQLG